MTPARDPRCSLSLAVLTGGSIGFGLAVGACAPSGVVDDARVADDDGAPGMPIAMDAMTSAATVDGGATCGTALDQQGCACLPGQTHACFTGPAALAGRGACTLGVQRCEGAGELGQFGACSGAGVPAPREVCGDRVDNDCDGQTDEGCTPDCTLGATRACSVMADGGTCSGTQTCVTAPDGRSWSACRPAPACGGSVPTVCASAIDATPSGIGSIEVAGDTCGQPNAVDLPCNTPGTPERTYVVHFPSGSSYFEYTISAGFTMAFSHNWDGDCGIESRLGCHRMQSKGASVPVGVAHENDLIVEREGGGCGPFTLTVHRIR